MNCIFNRMHVAVFSVLTIPSCIITILITLFVGEDWGLAVLISIGIIFGYWIMLGFVSFLIYIIEIIGGEA